MRVASPDQPRCWAYNKSGQRCSLEAGHKDSFGAQTTHSIVVTWEDADTVDPSHLIATAETTPRLPGFSFNPAAELAAIQSAATVEEFVATRPCVTCHKPPHADGDGGCDSYVPA